MRLIVGLVALLVIAAAAGCGQPPQAAPARAAAYTNPVYAGGADGLRESPDPGPLK